MLAAQMSQYMASLRHNLRQILRYSAKIFNETPTRRRRCDASLPPSLSPTQRCGSISCTRTRITHTRDSLQLRSLSSLLALWCAHDASLLLSLLLRSSLRSAQARVQYCKYGLLSLVLFLLRFAFLLGVFAFSLFCFALCVLLFCLSVRLKEIVVGIEMMIRILHTPVHFIDLLHWIDIWQRLHRIEMTSCRESRWQRKKWICVSLFTCN